MTLSILFISFLMYILMSTNSFGKNLCVDTDSFWFNNGQVTELGLADKVQLGWESPWWGSTNFSLNIIFTNDILGERVS